ncbi:Planctomycete cytochrome C [Singulisphaera sp. GP187]|uniref:PSD1 and planctomycete cytochrome C domain-containing protein n=1 Tax=Singulisphaera sp. GP187 TaxID=1882752 RepID=UPI00092CB493|nr:PSD1 and planctomycete cytochrome C domain-containing protein [Singulisphaera sp. GP187]SIN80861.1 Planctomycete cytochrome C [Singulisphaera sp. GP187]
MKPTLASLVGLIVCSRLMFASEPVDYVQDVKPILTKHCVSCHGATKPRANLRLDTAAAAIRGGDGGPSVVPGQGAESPLILAVVGGGELERMPLKRPPLTDPQIATLKAWIDQGAHAPEGERPDPAAAKHWAFAASVRPQLPLVSRSDWGQSPIDRLILSRLERERLLPSPEADRITLIRRVSLDLTGLLPTPEEVDSFVADVRPDAYERLVDRLLASPHFGERWARPWLDLARYADSNGYSIDAPRTIWKYRDWVINALNRDLPFDQFTIDQIAGDLHPEATLEQQVATGFHRNTPINQEGGIDLEQFRIESVVDRVATTATAFLGLTMGCAQCHDHKFDPISQREYYQFFAFFNNVDEPQLEFATPQQVAKRKSVRSRIAAFHKKLVGSHPELPPKVNAWELTLDQAFKTAQPDEIKAAFDKPFAKRTETQKRAITELFLAQDASSKALYGELAALRGSEPKFETTLVVRERAQPRETYIHLAGDFTRKGDRVAADVPKVLPALPSSASRNRMDLARWLVDPANPLTARVTMNRLWQAYFGVGLVETENDFGTQGTAPTHPELLDWLAIEFVDGGWSLKAMHRRIVTSMAYRQSSKARADVDAVDPGHRLIARQTRLRLDAEVIRDAALAATGLLTRRVGGPSVFPPQPDGVMTQGQMNRTWTPSNGPDRYRRGLYIYFWRATPHPSLIVFDAPNAVQACTRRIRSNTPLQALMLLNDQASFEFAQALAARLLRDAPLNDAERIGLAFRLCLSRQPTAGEQQRLQSLLADERDERMSGTELSAWTTLSRVLLNLDEFITRE